MKIIKRNGDVVDYQEKKIEIAIGKALGETNESIEWGRYEEMIAHIRNEIHLTDTTSIAEIQDIVEIALMRFGLYETAKRYILYRQERDSNRGKSWEMSDLQRDIFKQKYEHNGEGFEGFLDRVSDKKEPLKKQIRDKKFLFGGRILAGRGLWKEGVKVSYSNCYVLPEPEDNIESIFDTAKHMARTFSYGGGVGISVGKLRPRGSEVRNSAKKTTGAVSFMDLYSLTTELIGQSGRRAALMISIPCSHPDLEEFINVKSDLSKVTKANISVMVTDEFMRAVVNKETYDLTFKVESTGETIVKTVDADKVFTMLAKLNHNYAEPGILYWDTINDGHLMSEVPNFKFAGVNP